MRDELFPLLYACRSVVNEVLIQEGYRSHIQINLNECVTNFINDAYIISQDLLSGNCAQPLEIYNNVLYNRMHRSLSPLLSETEDIFIRLTVKVLHESKLKKNDLDIAMTLLYKLSLNLSKVVVAGLLLLERLKDE